MLVCLFVPRCKGGLLSVLVLGNIPTVMLLIIYALCRRGERTQRELNKMNAQDLS